jgi:hypothetical protein
MVIFVGVFVIVMVRFIRGIMMMDVGKVSSVMPMMNQAHDARPARDYYSPDNLLAFPGCQTR